MIDLLRLLLWLVALILMAPLWLLGFGFSGGLNWLVILMFIPLVAFPLTMMAISIRDWRATRRAAKED